MYHLNWDTFKSKETTQDIGTIKRDRKSIKIPVQGLDVDMKMSVIDTQFEGIV